MDVNKLPPIIAANKMFRLCAQIDLKLKSLRKRAIFMAGLSRCGKSTLFNYINNVLLYGVPPPGQENNALFGFGNIDVCYIPRITNADTAETKSGFVSVTTIPNIANREDYDLVDLAGYGDTRKYAQVIAVSYVIKAAFQQVEECQFVWTVKHDDFLNPNLLFSSASGFVKMFDFKTLKAQTKQKLFQSITMAVTKTPLQAVPQAYSNVLTGIIDQLNSGKLGSLDNPEEVTEFLQYFKNHPEQYFLFQAAQMNVDAPECTIVQNHFNKRTYFSLKKQSDSFYTQNGKPMIVLPFEEDFGRIKAKEEKQELNVKINERIKSYKSFANILKDFFDKAIKTQNFFNDKLNFNEEFRKVKQFNKDFEFYPEQFNLIEETKLETRISECEPPRKLQTGIRLAEKVFLLFEYFNRWPQYQNEGTADKLEMFMLQYTNHLKLIINEFRESFCSTYEEEQAILRFLFIALRGCRQFSMLYTIKTDGKYDMCLHLKDSFQSIMADNKLRTIQKDFIIQLYRNIQTVLKNVGGNVNEINNYLKYLSGLRDIEGCSDLVSLPEFISLKRIFLNAKLKLVKSPVELLISTFENFKEHMKEVDEKISQMNDQEGETYPEELNFKFYHYLAVMGNILLELERAEKLEDDPFAYENEDILNDPDTTTTIKQKLIIDQLRVARDIFVYIECIDSVIKSYELILRNIPENNHAKQVEWIKGEAKYCHKNGRTEQAIILFQKAMRICTIGNLCTEYQDIKKKLCNVYTEKADLDKEYFGNLKHKRIIDPSDDRTLERIINDINDLFITPYQKRNEQLQ